MSEPGPRVRISCPGCGRRRDWKPEYAGQTLACPCGATFVGNPGPSEILSNANPYDMHRDEKRAGGHTPEHERGAVGDPRIASRRLPPRTRRAAHEMQAEEDGASPWRDFYLPVGLLGIGLVSRFVQALAGGSSAGPGRAVALVLFSLVLVLIAWGLAFMTSMTIVGLELGDPKQVVLKIAGAAIFITAAVSLAASVDQEPGGTRGMVVGVNLFAALAFVLITYLFKLDLLDGLWTSVFVLIAQLCVIGAAMSAMGPVAAKGLFFGLR